MTTIPSNTCPQCGALIPEDSAHGLCPRCVFAKALASTADVGFVSYVPPSLESVRAAFPHLEVTALIGSGGMGAVFKARQPQLDRFVALKVLPAELAGQPGFSERFQREAQALARLSQARQQLWMDAPFSLRSSARRTLKSLLQHSKTKLAAM